MTEAQIAEHREAVRVGDEITAQLKRLKPFQRAWAFAIILADLDEETISTAGALVARHIAEHGGRPS